MQAIRQAFSLFTFLLSLFIAIAIAALVLVVCLNNTATIDIDLLFTQLNQVQLEVVMAVVFFVGCCFGWLMIGTLSIKRKLTRKK
jgi:uncharacterized membrane protein YciS (DUF1049 family)